MDHHHDGVEVDNPVLIERIWLCSTCQRTVKPGEDSHGWYVWPRNQP
jgi:hypothetical protein